MWTSSASSSTPIPSRSTFPKPLDGPALTADDTVDRRELLADWLTSPRNPFFAKAIVNRMWRNFMGRGLVEPVDDFRITNPATNEPLLDALAKDFIAHSYDLHHLIRTITASRAYQLSGVPTEYNRDDKMAYSRHYSRRLTAEQLLDSIAQATGVEEKFTSFVSRHARRPVAGARDRIVLPRSLRPPQPPVDLRAEATADAQPGAAPDQRRHDPEENHRQPRRISENEKPSGG